MRYDDGTYDTPLHGDEDGVVTCFMDKVVWDYEIGGDLSGSKLYPTEEAVYPYRGHGLVEVEVRLKRVVKENDFEEAAKDAISSKDLKEHLKQRHEDPEWQEYMRLREKYDTHWRHFKSLQGKREFYRDTYGKDGDSWVERRPDQEEVGKSGSEGKVDSD
jgi:hypothetical protein